MAQYLNSLVYRPDWCSEAITVAPTVEPVTLTEVKAHCRIDHSDDDTMLAGLTTAARVAIENETRRALITQTRTLSLSDFPHDDQLIELPSGEIQSIISIAYTDGNGDSQTLSASAYALNGDRVSLKFDQSWPDVQLAGLPVVITYVCGYADSGASPVDLADNVPWAIKAAILMLIGHWYENREAATEGAMVDLPMGVKWLLSPYKVHSVFA